MQFRVVVGDITKWQADAIVNSANTTLLGSGGVDTAIHQAGGISLTAACQALRGCRMGEAKFTYGYRLPAKYVIHAVGPIWVGGKRDEEAVLASCYKRSLELAVEKGVKHLAFTSIATGSNKFPPARAAAIAVPILMNAGQGIERIDIVCQDKELQYAYTRAVVAFWLEHLVTASESELPRIADEAIPALVLLHCADDEPDPAFLSQGIRLMKNLLAPFMDGTMTCSLIDMDRITDKIMTHAYC